MLLTVVIPVYNEAEGIQHFHHKLLIPALVKSQADSYEVIYVNDGSSDTTLEILTQIAAADSKIRVVNLSRNFGKEIATTAGISVSSGDATIVMDGDGQHPPKLIPDFLKKWRQGAQVVIGVRSSNQKEGIIKKSGSQLFYRLFNATSDSKLVPRSTDFRLIDAEVRDAFNQFTERNRITRGLIDWLGFSREYIEFAAPARIAGEASYSTKQLIKLAFHSFVSLSLKPLYLFGWVGILITTLSLFAGIFLFVEQIILGDPLSLGVTGAALIGVFVSFLTGLILTSQGMLAVYLSHVFAQTQGRPLFVIDRSKSIGINNIKSIYEHEKNK